MIRVINKISSSQKATYCTTSLLILLLTFNNNNNFTFNIFTVLSAFIIFSLFAGHLAMQNYPWRV